MDRQKLVEIAYQKGKKLYLNNKKYQNWIESFFEKEYIDDIGTGDITSESVLSNNRIRKAFVKSKAKGILAGIEEISWFFHKHGLRAISKLKDGEAVSNGEVVLEIQGKQKKILATERIALNVLQRMSGIATETKKLNILIRDYKTRIAATRKTVLKYLDKKAVFLGGGLTHRFGLWDSIIIKDNHLENLKSDGMKNYIEVAIEKASTFANNIDFIEIEVNSHKETIRAAKKIKNLQLDIPFIIMLDNISPSKIENIIKTLRQKKLYDFVLLEASGKITPKNIHEYANTGVDVVSLGYLTNSAKALDMSLEMLI